MAKAEPKGSIMSRANSMISGAITYGRLVRPEICEQCGDEHEHSRGSRAYIQAHHDDYSKPMEVRWLCGSCHNRWHVVNGPGLAFDFSSMVRRIHDISDLSDFPPSYVKVLRQQVIETGMFCAGLVNKEAPPDLLKAFSVKMAL